MVKQQKSQPEFYDVSSDESEPLAKSAIDKERATGAGWDASSNDSQISADSALIPEELEFSAADVTMDGENSSMDAMFENFAAILKKEFDRERQKERVHLHQAFRNKVKQLEAHANRKLQEKLINIRARDKAHLVRKEQHLNDMLGQLNHLGQVVGGQLQVLERTRQQLDDKLREGDALNTELQTVGVQLSTRINELSLTIVDDSIADKIKLEKGAS